jgi:hypothetical protein
MAGFDRKVVLIFPSGWASAWKRSDKVAPTQTAVCPWVRAGAASFWIMRLIDDGSECNFLDKVVVGGRRFDRLNIDHAASKK